MTASAASAAPAAPFRVAAVQTVTGTSLDANLARADALIAEAVRGGAELVLLPEYFCMMGRQETDKVAIREQDGDGPVQRFLADAARRHRVWLVGGTLPLHCGDEGRVYNTSLAFDPRGERVARYDKIHLFGFTKGTESYDESRTILAGTEPVAFEAPCGRVAMSVCYDLRFPELYRHLAAGGGTSLILMPAAFTYTHGPGALGDPAAGPGDREPVLCAGCGTGRQARKRPPHVGPHDAGRSVGRGARRAARGRGRGGRRDRPGAAGGSPSEPAGAAASGAVASTPTTTI